MSNRSGISPSRLSSLAGIFSLSIFAASPAWAVSMGITAYGGPATKTYAVNNYHSQITPYYCGAAAIQMQLDSDQWRNNLIGLTNGFGVGGIRNQATQNTIYTISHGNSLPNWASDPNGLTIALNTYAGAGNFQEDDDAPVAANAGAGIQPWNTAARNIAEALQNSNAPVSILVNHSAHWVDVSGVVTQGGGVVPGGAFTIYGFIVRDPWPLAGTMGANSFFANNARAFGRYFTPAKPQAGKSWSSKYVSVVDPLASDPSTYGSEPLAFPTVPLIGDGSTAAGDAGLHTDGTDPATEDTEIDADSGMSVAADFIGADAMFESFPDDTGGEGDWLVPYESSPGVVSGFELIDDETGQIDQATWFDPDSPTMDLTTLYTDVGDEFSGNLFEDADVPEPATLALFAVAAPLLLRRRRKS